MYYLVFALLLTNKKDLLICVFGCEGLCFGSKSRDRVKAGVAAGMPVVGLGARDPEKLLLEAGASFVIQDFDDPKLWTTLEDLINN